MCITVTQCNEGKELSGQPKMHKRWPHNMEHKLFKFQFDDNCKQRYHCFKLWCSSNQNYLYLNNRTAGCENNSSLLARVPNSIPEPGCQNVSFFTCFPVFCQNVSFFHGRYFPVFFLNSSQGEVHLIFQ